MQISMESLMDKKVPDSDMCGVTSDTVADEMKACVALAAGPARYGDTIEAMLWRAAQALGFPQRRVRSFWYRTARNVTAVEYLTARARANELIQKQVSLHERIQETREAIARGRSLLAGGAGEQLGGSARAHRPLAERDGMEDQ